MGVYNREFGDKGENFGSHPGTEGGKERIGRGQSRERSTRPNRWKEIYSSRAPAAGLKYGVDVETPPPPPPLPPSPSSSSSRTRSNAMPCYLVTRWNYIGFFLVARPVCRNRTGIRDDSMPDIFSAAEPGRNAASRRHPIITTRVRGDSTRSEDLRLFLFSPRSFRPWTNYI